MLLFLSWDEKNSCGMRRPSITCSLEKETQMKGKEGATGEEGHGRDLLLLRGDVASPGTGHEDKAEVWDKTASCCLQSCVPAPSQPNQGVGSLWQ